jgi:hypothetical protein
VIDNFALAITHGLMILAAWRLLSRPDLDDESAAAPDPEARPTWNLRRDRGIDPGA